ncbi:threonine deaminase [Haematococcus lacustris]|uniref:Threonine deaminase n=1 Tax=Haematococcus lacustris TaxID=44745 RepID=A0A6A0A7Y4_HAELA|nr:threonine deaminase [Haematococcus lacustris]
MPTQDISGLEVAQLHLRHLVGGRARSYMGSLPHEAIYQIIFPETPGALSRFLSAVSPTWNITLFHYRNTGNRESSVLLGVQVSPEDAQHFAAARASLTEFTFKELPADVRNVFDQFIQ